MGLYSEVINLCPWMGSRFIGLLQTKNLECILDQYFLAKDGTFYRIYNPVNSENGLVKPYRITLCIDVVNSHFDRATLCLKDGVLVHWVTKPLTPGRDQL